MSMSKSEFTLHKPQIAKKIEKILQTLSTFSKNCRAYLAKLVSNDANNNTITTLLCWCFNQHYDDF